MRIRGKRMGWTMAAAVLLLSAIAAGWWWKTAALNGKAAGGSAGVWAERANMAQAELTKSFWDEKRKLYNNASPCMMQACTDPFNYWWLAHAVDLAADGWLRTGDETYKQRLAALHQGILDRNAGVWPNDYYDDIAWMGLAWLRAFDATQEPKYKEAALVLWEDIKTGWNEEMGGGIAWRKEQLNYKNTPANAPSVILSARLYQRFGDKANLDWAMRIYDWEKRNLVIPNPDWCGTA